MSSKMIKEFAQEVNLDKKQLQNKLAYWKKKGKETWNFSDTFSDGVRILTKAEQERIYELLGIPIFRQVSDDSESLSEADSSFRSAHLKEKILLLEHQLLEIKSDKEYLKNQVLKGQNEKEELLQSNAELRILLQNTIKQNGTLQNSLSELTSENLKNKLSERSEITEEKRVQIPSEKASNFYFNSEFKKNNPEPISFEERYPEYKGFFSELFKYKKKRGSWSTAYRHSKRLAKLKKKNKKTLSDDA